MLVNEKQVGPITPKRGHQQGDPLSPYLFIICDEGLSTIIRKFEVAGSLHGVKVCIRAPNVSHLLFANDCFLFFKAYVKECNVMKGDDAFSTGTGIERAGFVGPVRWTPLQKQDTKRIGGGSPVASPMPKSVLFREREDQLLRK